MIWESFHLGSVQAGFTRREARALGGGLHESRYRIAFRMEGEIFLRDHVLRWGDGGWRLSVLEAPGFKQVFEKATTGVRVRDGALERMLEGPDDLVPSYAVLPLLLSLPFPVGAQRSFTRLNEGDLAMTPAVLVGTGPDAAVGGAWRIEERAGDRVLNVHWRDAEGVCQSDWSGAVSRRGAREVVLAGLDREMRVLAES